MRALLGALHGHIVKRILSDDYNLHVLSVCIFAVVPVWTGIICGDTEITCLCNMFFLCQIFAIFGKVLTIGTYNILIQIIVLKKSYYEIAN